MEQHYDASDDRSAGGGPRVESVPSDQLWRAAILATRRAAVSAAELRRALIDQSVAGGASSAE